MFCHTRITFLRNAYFVFTAVIALTLSACAPSTPTPAAPVLSAATPMATPLQTQPPAEPTVEPVATSGYVFPTPDVQICSPLAVQPLDKLNRIITQPFINPRIMDDGTYKDSGHHGLDVGFISRGKLIFTGTPVLSAIDGKVAAFQNVDRPPYGLMVIVETPYDKIPSKMTTRINLQNGDSLYTLYAHMQNLPLLKIGDTIHCGQQLGETGLTGTTGGPHLHFETRWGPPGTQFPIMAYYGSDVTEEEIKNYTLWRMSGKYRLYDPFLLLDP